MASTPTSDTSSLPEPIFTASPTSTSTSSLDTIVPSSSPLSDFPSLSLTLSRDQGTHHTSGSGAGSESHELSVPADTQHELLASQYLPLTKKSTLVSHALKPDLPRWKAGDTLEGELNNNGSSSSRNVSGSGISTPDGLGLDGGISSTNATPGISRMGTPTPTISSIDTSPGTATPPLQSSTQQSPVSATTGLLPVLAATTPGGTSAPPSTSSTPTKSSSPSPTSSAPVPVPAQIPIKPVEKEKKSVFGKLFERNNNSSTSLANGSSNSSNGGGTHSTTGGGGVSSEKMERGDSNATSTSSIGGSAGGASLARKPSKKQKEQAEKERKAEISRASSISRSASTEGRPRSESQSRSRAESGSNGYLSSSGNGMGAALNEFMKNKISRKSSVNSKKSDDGKSERAGGSQAGDSQYGGSTKGGSTKGDDKSRSGQTTASLLKKYGVCEKVAIGKGATAVVKLAHKWDRTTERLYAVKEFRKRRKNETEKEYVKKLTSEFCISSTLHHHNIVETVDLVQDEQSHWCEVMEYCPGGDLYAAIKKGNMSSPEINSYFKQIISGVTYLHSMGVAHRDIKPENLLLDAKGHVKITDFGVSDVFRMCWEKTTHLSKGLCGSEPYIAPEQFEVKEYDARQVDVWACAVVFYCMHFQELPWRVAKPTDPTFGPYVQMYAGSASPAPISNLVPRECRTIIKKMLDPDPKTRATTETIAADPWFIGIVVVPPLDGVIIAPVIPLPPLV